MTSLARLGSLAAILCAASAAHADDGALRILVRGDLDRTAVAAEIAAELGIATSLVDDDADCIAPCAVVLVAADRRATIDMRGTGAVRSRTIELPAGSGAAEIVALVVGNLARDEAAALLADLEATTAAGAPATTAPGATAATAGGTAAAAGRAPAPDAPAAPVIVPAAPRAATGTARTFRGSAERPRDPEAPTSFSFGLVPPLAIDVAGPRGGGGIALDVLIGGHRRLAAFSVSGIGSVVTESVAGTQIGGVFAAGGHVQGAQVGGAVAAARRVDGAQIGGAVALAGPVRGAQIGGALAIAPEVRGAQIGGAVALAGRGVNTQIGGALAASAGAANLQIGGALAVAGGDVHTQIAGALAVAGGDVRGLQIAPLNVARRVEGVQVGVVNVAGGGDGVSVGLLNLVRGGRTEVEATVDQRQVGALVLRHGGRRWHNVYGVAARADRGLLDEEVTDDDVWMYGFGMGPSWRRGASTVDLEAMAWHVVYGDRLADHVDVLGQLRLVVGHPVGPAHLVIGGALNTYVTTDESRPSAFSPRVVPGTPPPMAEADDVRVELWPSLFVGVRL